MGKLHRDVFMSVGNHNFMFCGLCYLEGKRAWGFCELCWLAHGKPKGMDGSVWVKTLGKVDNA